MNCKEKNTFPFWNFVQKFPALRYLKAPVFNVQQLYERYYDGLESGAFAFVISKFCFYGWDFELKMWRKIGFSIEDLLKEGFIKDAPSDDTYYIRYNGKWVRGVEEAPINGKPYHRINGHWEVCTCGETPLPPEISMAVDPQSIFFNPESDQQAVSVIISGVTDNSFTVNGVPSWLSIQGQTTSGFTLLANDNSNSDTNRYAVITVKSNADPTIQKTIDITQYGEWLSTFIFDVNIPSSDVNNNVRIFNLGTDPSFGSLGDARVDWEGSGNWEEILNIPYGTVLSPAPNDPTTGGTISAMVGDDQFHTYTTPGTRTVTVQTRNGVNSFRFAVSSQSPSLYDFNKYVTIVRKFHSNYITNGNMMFYGIKYLDFPPDFKIETPNLVSFEYMFYGSGCGDNVYGAVSAGYSKIFPEHFWDNIASKTCTKATRMYSVSGFSNITRPMLKFSTQLTAVLETFRGMPLVGANWTDTFNITHETALSVKRFIDLDLFYDNTNINDFRGCFWFINDWYGNFKDAYGYSYPLFIDADLFLGNTAQDIDVSFMFVACNRAVVEVDLFRHIKTRLKKFNGLFWGGFNYGGTPRCGGTAWFIPGGYFPFEGGNTVKDYRGATDINLLFPDNEYPNVTEAVAWCGWKYNSYATGNSVVPGMRAITNGVQHLLIEGSWGIQNWTGWLQDQTSLSVFMAKFPNCTSGTGKHPHTGAPVHGFAYSFWDFAMTDESYQKRVSDYDANAEWCLEADNIDLFGGDSVIGGLSPS